MEEGPSAAPSRAILWNESSDLTPRFWTGLVAGLLLGDFPGDTSDRFRDEASENGLLIEDPAFRRTPSATRFVAWSDIAELRPAGPVTRQFATIVRTDGTRLHLGDGHASPSNRQERFDVLRRWFEVIGDRHRPDRWTGDTRAVVLIPGGPVVNALIVLGMVVLIVYMARNFWRVAKAPERRPGEPPDDPDRPA
jgi:hypothetical protein